MSGATVRIGQRVRLPWGLESVEGTIVDVFGPPARRFVRVAVELPQVEYPEDPPVVALPLDSVEVVAAA